MFSVGILTVSDKGAAGEREDVSGRLLHELVPRLPGKVVDYHMVPDDRATIREALIAFSDPGRVDLVLTTGGTGISPRDVTPDATRDILDYLVPGIGEVMRMEGYRKNPRAIISRGIGGVRRRTLFVNLPGSPRAVRECFDLLLPALPHAIEKIRGEGGDCG